MTSSAREWHPHRSELSCGYQGLLQQDGSFPPHAALRVRPRLRRRLEILVLPTTSSALGGLGHDRPQARPVYASFPNRLGNPSTPGNRVVSSLPTAVKTLPVKPSAEEGARRGSFAVKFFDSGLDQATAHRVAHKTCCFVNIQFLHQPHAMRFGRLHTDTQKGGGILSRFPLGNHLQHLALTRCQGIGRAILLSAGGLHHCPRYARTQLKFT